MNASNSKRVWIWKQLQGRFFKVISDPKQGYIHVYNEKNEMVLKKENLTEDQVKLIEKHFLDIVVNNSAPKKKSCTDSFDPMVA
jgi:hypothetical protein